MPFYKRFSFLEIKKCREKQKELQTILDEKNEPAREAEINVLKRFNRML